MTHTTNMCGSNLKEYAQDILDNKQIAVSTRAEWNMLIKRLPLENFTYPPVEIDLYKMVATKYSNPRTRRGVLQTLNCLLGTKMKTGKPSHPVFDLPDFEELDSYIQTPKNKYQARCRMYANLMLHAGLRIGETQIKHQVVKNSINVEYQRIISDNSIQKAKTTGLVALPSWLMDEYKEWKVDVSSHRCLRDWFQIYFNSDVGIPLKNLSPHKLRHIYATHYATKLPPSVLQKQLRHSKIDTTMSYYVHINEDVIMAVLNESRNRLRVVAN